VGRISAHARFPVLRVAASLDGWLARRYETWSGIWSWKRSPIRRETEPRRRLGAAEVIEPRILFAAVHDSAHGTKPTSQAAG
jgi:hypothetical protein